MAKPDILLIILDTQRRDRLSIYGHARPTSPGFDEFASRATLFERAVAPSQWTIPAHSSIFTGLYPSIHGVTEANGQLSPAHPTLAEILQVGGYHTAAFCNNPLVGALDNGLQRGFTEFYNYASAVPNRPGDNDQSDLRRRFRRWFRPYARRIGNQFARSDELFRVSLHPLLTPIWSKYINFKGSTAHSIDDLIAYWDSYHAGGAEQPIFGFLNLMGTHLPYHPPQDVMNLIAPELRSDRAAYSYMNRFNADGAGWASPPDKPFSEWERAVLNGFYDAEIAAQDAHLNRLLLHLRQSGALDNTCVIIAADHGEGHGEHDLFGHGFNVYQELVHVPLVIHAPDYEAGKRVTRNVSTRRLFHTILDMAGIAPPLDEADPNANVAGLSLINALNGATDVEGGLAFSEAFPPRTFLNVHRTSQPRHDRAPAAASGAPRDLRGRSQAGDERKSGRGTVQCRQRSRRNARHRRRPARPKRRTGTQNHGLCAGDERGQDRRAAQRKSMRRLSSSYGRWGISSRDYSR